MTKICETCGEQTKLTKEWEGVGNRLAVRIGSTIAIDFGSLPQHCQLCLTARPPRHCLGGKDFLAALEETTPNSFAPNIASLSSPKLS